MNDTGLFSSVKSSSAGAQIGDTARTLNLYWLKSNQTLVFEGKGKPEYPKKNLSYQSREPRNQEMKPESTLH